VTWTGPILPCFVSQQSSKAAASLCGSEGTGERREMTKGRQG
jgi:hypothetical protein